MGGAKGKEEECCEQKKSYSREGFSLRGLVFRLGDGVARLL